LVSNNINDTFSMSNVKHGAIKTENDEVGTRSFADGFPSNLAICSSYKDSFCSFRHILEDVQKGSCEDMDIHDLFQREETLLEAS